ncbi:MAG TPA: 50S ribosomal protein L6 [Candidatus Azoamicus sp. OHIO1]
MYKFHKKRIIIPDNVQVEFKNHIFYFSGPKGSVEHIVSGDIFIEFFSNEIVISSLPKKCRVKKISQISSLINTTYALFKNYIYGVVNYFQCNLILRGIGYKAQLKGNVIELLIGYSHPVQINVPSDILVELPSNIEIIIKGISKCKVGDFSASIRMKRVPEVYKGNGIRYKDEIVSLKSPKKNK